MKPKSQSLKIRAIIFRIWQNNTNRERTAEEYYQLRTDAIIALLMRELGDAPLPEED